MGTQSLNPKVRGKKYEEARKLIEVGKIYSTEEAFNLIKKTSFAKFDSTIEAHIKLKLKKGQNARGTLVLPHGSGKEPKVAIFNNNMVEKIQKGKIDFDILLAKPSDMPSLVKVAKILGPKGLMPSPKAKTVTEHPEETMKKIKSGQIEYKADPQGIIHQIIGKVSWDVNKLSENLKVLLDATRQYNPISVTICATMSPGVKIKI